MPHDLLVARPALLIIVVGERKNMLKLWVNESDASVMQIPVDQPVILAWLDHRPQVARMVHLILALRVGHSLFSFQVYLLECLGTLFLPLGTFLCFGAG